MAELSAEQNAEIDRIWERSGHGTRREDIEAAYMAGRRPYEIAMTPKLWTKAHINAWRQNLPATGAAFAALRAIAEGRNG